YHYLDQHAEVAAVVSGVELVECHRDVHPLQLQAVAESSPSNLLMRRAVAYLLGGFLDDPACRGQAGAEAGVFRMALAAWFKVVGCEERFLRYWVRRGNHFDYFLDRTSVVDGKLVFDTRSSEESSGTLEASMARYFSEFNERMAALASLKSPGEAFPDLNSHLFHTIATYDQLRESIESVEGSLHCREGYALFQMAKAGQGQGAVVDLGSYLGRSTCWLAAGSRIAAREKVTAVDEFL